MPVVESRCVVPVEPDVAFAVSQTQGAIRKRWDPFIRRQHLMDGATVPAKGVRTYTVQRFGLAMESEYVSYHPPSNVGMKMTKGSWFFERMGGRLALHGGRGAARAHPRDLALQLHVPAEVARTDRRAHRRARAAAGHRPAHPGVRPRLRGPRRPGPRGRPARCLTGPARRRRPAGRVGSEDAVVARRRRRVLPQRPCILRWNSGRCIPKPVVPERPVS